MGVRNLLASIRAFLRAGYPSDAPPFGYVPLLALLPRRISEDDITRITTALARRRRPLDRPIDNVDVGVEITRITREMPSLDDIDRVRDRLDAQGRPGR